ncbi:MULTISPECIES: hypothetical protein [unclassified Mesorhizobium]|uniref:hypothetical protein n=1 Tax=unclassified Mesorhizobium TaxID=325217 RepID=UPI000BAF23D8|nr:MULTISPECIES: hypothetical protein [unclassified Mesorhizobium]TGT56757.1 hypothetical protein EN813_040715 [Mesorhizobium sp. M00.F.Ca.ET.170.01.1.1]AZO08524.1 hypothetical protein EJ074_04820 [Mesorhizobium sp. M3A.F.Ca.ET.080.04.2.1]PBB85590.1 hypothetical protein CK216_17200 [Mesorhizobium sp. WSM3876]RWB71642.1 MAG: hypothetical protein EOQ49_14030 [Mesorhizobium sp.]RWB85105.1 MAG: hypothetical protein EOQ52_22875 [Mesorhizobium sp.]
MARIIVITHEHDQFLGKRDILLRRGSPYLLFDILGQLKSRGHSIRIQQGLSKRHDADIAVLHVDATTTSADYLDYAGSFPFCLNVGAADISKRKISGALVSSGEVWQGPVIVKSNLNNQGIPETLLNRRAKRAGKSPPFPDVPVQRAYEVYASLGEVPDGIFGRDDLVVEKFIPEKEHDGFAARFWVFCGEHERCTRYVSPNSLVKASETIRREPVPVPDEMRERRRELGFDYGKFDFVMHEGKAVLLDANKTPGRPKNLVKMFAAGAAHLADGFEALMRKVV